MVKLTAVQKVAYEKLSKTEPRCAYELRASLSTLRALVKKGKAKEVETGGLGEMFSPRTAIEFLAV